MHNYISDIKDYKLITYFSCNSTFLSYFAGGHLQQLHLFDGNGIQQCPAAHLFPTTYSVTSCQ